MCPKFHSMENALMKAPVARPRARKTVEANRPFETLQMKLIGDCIVCFLSSSLIEYAFIDHDLGGRSCTATSDALAFCVWMPHRGRASPPGHSPRFPHFLFPPLAPSRSVRGHVQPAAHPRSVETPPCKQWPLPPLRSKAAHAGGSVAQEDTPEKSQRKS